MSRKDGAQRRPEGDRRGAIREETSAGGIVFRRRGARGARGALKTMIRDSYRNWGFPKGHVKDGEAPDRAALREVLEETGLASLELRSPVNVIDWHFRFRGRAIHKVCHFYLMETGETRTKPQRAEGITACRWVPYHVAARLVSYANARAVLRQARELLRAAPLEAS